MNKIIKYSVLTLSIIVYFMSNLFADDTIAFKKHRLKDIELGFSVPFANDQKEFHANTFSLLTYEYIGSNNFAIEVNVLGISGYSKERIKYYSELTYRYRYDGTKELYSANVEEKTDTTGMHYLTTLLKYYFYRGSIFAFNCGTGLSLLHQKINVYKESLPPSERNDPYSYDDGYGYNAYLNDVLCPVACVGFDIFHCRKYQLNFSLRYYAGTLVDSKTEDILMPSLAISTNW
jgi:hypothetical protein